MKKIIFTIIVCILLIFLFCKNNDTKNTPNEPELTEFMIPITHNGNSWVKADINNANNNWYDYEGKKWANVVIVDEKSVDKYKKLNVGETIYEEDVLAYYVWIPRYKYQIFNIDKIDNIDFYNAKEKGINIIFEKGTESTGTIKCNYIYEKKYNQKNNEKCSGKNGEWYTHPAFTFGEKELSGIWVGKFETTGTYKKPTILPNESALNSVNISTGFYTISNMINENIFNSHLIKNIDWGAVTYLSHSIYGRCDGGSCEKISINNQKITGSGTKIENEDASYNTEQGMLASTTGNIYGIYDMSGGLQEYVMGNVSNKENQLKFNALLSGFEPKWIEKNSKYIDIYAYNTASFNENLNIVTKLGDAIGETKSWYKDNNYFITDEVSWLERGGNYNITLNSGIFSYNSNFGYNTRMNGFRAVITKN